MINQKIINKTMDVDDLESDGAKKIVRELNDLVISLKNRHLRASSWYGKFELTGEKTSTECINRGYDYKPLNGAADDVNFPWFLYWEIVWVTLHAEFKERQTVLDLGGSSSLFSYYLTSKGLDVTTVDLQKGLVDNANVVAQNMNWRLRNSVMDMRKLDCGTQFDHITSICVYEHIPMYDRVDVNKHIEELLIPGGRFSITFDYRNPSRFARINSPSDVDNQFVRPSKLVVRENQEFVDTAHNYLLHPFYYKGTSWKYKLYHIMRGSFGPWEIFGSKKSNDYTFGALFLEKRPDR